MQQHSEALSLEQVLGFLRRRLPLIVLCAVIAAGVAYGLSKREAKKYTASASLVFSSNPLSEQIAGLIPSGGGSNLLIQQANNLELVKGGDVAAKTASLLGHGLTERMISGSVSVTGQGESGVVDISATSASPALAAEIANTYTRQFVKEQQAANRRYFKSALALVRKQLAALSPQQRVGADGLQLQNRAQTLSLLAELDYGNVQVGQEALAPTSPSSPRTSRNTALGLLLGLLLGIGLAFAFERLDRRLRGPGELETIYRLPLLGSVPRSAALARHRGRVQMGLPAAVAEAFGLIRAQLRFFHVNRDLCTIMIASPSGGEGKTTVARHLAEAAVRSGSRVLLLEANFRDPVLSRQLGVEAGPGLADVLIGDVPIGEAVQRAGSEQESERSSERTLDVLVAGAVSPPNPIELIESDAMQAVLDWGRAAYELVVIDTPALTVVSDAYALLERVDGMIVVGRVEYSRRDAAAQLRRVLTSSGVSPLGVIANGCKAGAPTLDHSPPGTPTGRTSLNGASSPRRLVPTAKT